MYISAHLHTHIHILMYKKCKSRGFFPTFVHTILFRLRSSVGCLLTLIPNCNYLACVYQNQCWEASGQLRKQCRWELSYMKWKCSKEMLLFSPSLPCFTDGVSISRSMKPSSFTSPLIEDIFEWISHSCIMMPCNVSFLWCSGPFISSQCVRADKSFEHGKN